MFNICLSYNFIFFLTRPFSQNLRRRYLEAFQSEQERLGASANDTQIYNDLTHSEKVEKLLESAGFTYMLKNDGSNKHAGTQYPHFRAAVLRDEEIWNQFERLLSAFQELEIPHPGVAVAGREINEALNAHKWNDPKQRTKVVKLINRFVVLFT